MKKALITALAITLQISCALAGVPRTWDADVGSPAAFQTSAWQGETVELAAQLVRGRKPFAIPEGATAGLWWRTNGMDRYWGPAPAEVSTNGVVSATWSPTNDVGAASYRGFLGVSLSGDGSNLTYAANFTLRMLESPGFAPNSLPLPVQSIDFSSVQVLNAPWIEEESDPVWEAEKGGYATTNDATYTVNGKRLSNNSILFTNGWGVAIDEINKSSLIHGFLGLTGIRISLSDEFFDELGETLYGLRQSQEEAAVAATNYTDAAVAAIDIPDPDLSFTNDFARTESLANLKGEIEDGWWSEWRYISHCDPYTPQQGRTLRYLGNNTWSFGRYVDGTWVSDDTITAPENATSIYFVDRGDGVTATRRRVAAPVPTKAEDIGAQPAGDYATPSEVSGEISAASNALARAWSADSVLLSSMLLGSNVVAEVTNYNSQVRSPTLRLLQLNESNEYFQVWAETNNLSRVALAATNHADTVSAAAYNAATNYAAPRAWSGTTSGLGADAPEGWTWISTPQMAIAGGLEYEKNITSGGAIWILKSNGMAADFHSVSNNTAYLDISATDGSSLFRIEKTDSFLVGVDTTSVNVRGDALICGVNCVSATHPLVRVRQSLTQGDWSREEDGIPANLATVEWSGESGAWVCEITNTSGGHSMFATMEMLQEGGAKLVNAASLDVSSSGILCTDGVHKVRPVYSNGAITWEVFQ